MYKIKIKSLTVSINCQLNNKISILSSTKDETVLKLPAKLFLAFVKRIEMYERSTMTVT